MIISCGEMSWFMLLPSILSFSIAINYIVIQQLFKENLWHQLFIFAASNSLCKISMFFINCFIKKRERNSTKKQFKSIIPYNELTRTTVSDFHELKQGTLSKTIVILFILLCSLFHYINYVFHFIFRFIKDFALTQTGGDVKSKYYGILIIFFQIIVLTPLNKKVFNDSLYKHQKVSLGLIILGTFLYLFRIISDGGDYGMFFFLSGTVLYCFEIVIEKYLMENKYITIFEILFYEGCTEFCINSFVFVICYTCFTTNNKILFFEVEIQNFNELLEAFQKIGSCIAMLILHFIINAIIEMSMMMTNFYLNPNFSYVSEIVSIFFIWILELIYLKPHEFLESYSIEKIIGYFILLFGALIYNEIIILYFCGLETNTKKEIINRAAFFNNEFLLNPTAKEDTSIGLDL